MKRLRFIPACLLVMICWCFNSPAIAQADSAKTLALETFLQLVRQFHPVARQAEIGVQRGQLEVQRSRGAFDPVLSTQLDRKVFSEELYYNIHNPQIKIPTWYGIEVKGGTEELIGGRVDPQQTLGQTSYLGLVVPLAKNLLMDKRRAALQQAKLFSRQAIWEQRQTMNDLLYEATGAWWNWVQRYAVFKVYEDVLELNKKRLDLTRTAFFQGDRAALDTTEALARLQSIQYLASASRLDWLNSGLELSVYLWQNNDVPYELPPNVLPDSLWEKMTVSLPSSESLLQAAANEHPKLKIYEFKIQSLEIERKLKFQNLLPTVNLKYNLLNKGYNVVKGLDRQFLSNNYKFGVEFYMPLFQREARADFKDVKLKQQQTNYELQLLQLDIRNKLRRYLNDWNLLSEQTNMLGNVYLQNDKLFRGEDLRFRLGESTLFLLNARENALLDSRIKLVELRVKYLKSAAAVIWASGGLR